MSGSIIRRRLRGPKWLYFEFVNTCNADCIFCAYRYDPRPKLTLGLDRIVTAAKRFRATGGDLGRLKSTAGRENEIACLDNCLGILRKVWIATRCDIKL